jgi:hypothetical protein
MTEHPPIIVVNASSICPDDEVRHYVAALQTFMPKFCAAWKLPGVDVAFMPHGQQIPHGMWVQVVADTSDQAGALGYHETARGNFPIGFTFAKTGRAAGSSVSGTLSHEIWEMLGDPFIDRVVVEPATGRRWDVENADAVENDEYAIRVPMPTGPDVMLSDFVLPSYYNFAAPEGAPYDYRGLLTKPIPAMLPGGYLAFQEPNGRWGQIDAFEAHEHRARAAARPQALSRRYRRMFGTWQESQV